MKSTDVNFDELLARFEAGKPVPIYTSQEVGLPPNAITPATAQVVLLIGIYRRLGALLRRMGTTP